MKRMCLSIIVIVMLMSLTLMSFTAKANDFGYSNEETIKLGVRVSERVFHHSRGINDLVYYMACARYGLMIFSETTNQPQLINKMEKAYRPFKKGWAKTTQRSC